MTDELQIAIVGAGIGGLTAALALRARGLSVTVFERAASPRELGAGISIHPNAVRLLSRIRLHDWLENINTRSVGLSLWTSRGEPVPMPPASPDSPTYQVHRVELLEMLNDAQADVLVRFGHDCTGVKETEDDVRLTFANGVTACADVVIGADGIHSVVQREISLVTHPTRRHHGLPRLDPVGETFMGEGSSRVENVDGFGPELHLFPDFTGTRDQHRRFRAKQP